MVFQKKYLLIFSQFYCCCKIMMSDYIKMTHKYYEQHKRKLVIFLLILLCINLPVYLLSINYFEIESLRDLKLEDLKSILYTCQPRKKIVYLKTHKTGSTTLQNIFYRFGSKEKLIFLLPKNTNIYYGNNAELYPEFTDVR